MDIELLHFRDSEKILNDKNMMKDVQVTLEYLSDVLYGTLHRGELMRQALEEMDWRGKDNGNLKILENRRYMYKGYKKGVALEGNFSVYEFILEGLFRLQVGYDKGKIETGVLMLTSLRSEKSSYGTSKKLAEVEVEMLYPTISMPVTIALFDLGVPMTLDTEGGDANGISVQANDK